MNITLTRDTDKTLCLIYKDYLNLKKSGFSKEQSNHFSKDEFSNNHSLNYDDLCVELQELKADGLVDTNVIGNFKLTTDGIIYMENRFGKRIDKILDYLSKLKP